MWETLESMMTVLTQLYKKQINAAWGQRWSEKQWEDKLEKIFKVLFLFSGCYFETIMACPFNTQIYSNSTDTGVS